MRRAFLVLGAESSGTKVVTEALCHGGCHGSWADEQPFDDLKFDQIESDFIVFRRTIPHGTEVVSISKIMDRMQNAGYDVTPIVTARKMEYAAKAQVKRGHVRNHETAIRHIQRAYMLIATELLLVQVMPVVIGYELFSESESYRKVLCDYIGLSWGAVEANMVFFNANGAYDARPS